MQSKLINLIEEMDVACKKQIDESQAKAEELRNEGRQEANRILEEARTRSKELLSQSIEETSTTENSIIFEQIEEKKRLAETRQDEAVQAILESLEA